MGSVQGVSSSLLQAEQRHLLVLSEHSFEQKTVVCVHSQYWTKGLQGPWEGLAPAPVPSPLKV